METTVTMSLERYKELESYEQVFHKMVNVDKENKYVWASASGRSFLIMESDEANAELGRLLNQARRERDHTIQKVREYEEKHNKKVF